MSITPLMPVYARSEVRPVRGEHCHLIGEDGRRYLDFAAGIAVNALGHSHAGLIGAIQRQAATLMHCSNLYGSPQGEHLAQRLVDLTFADTVFFTNSGTETMELAVKMARKYWYEKGEERTGILTFEGSFHGRSTGAIAAAASEKMVKGFGPLMPGFRSLPWADMAALKAAIGPQTCAVMVEPVQGEGGIRPLSDADLKQIRALCDETGALLIFDEVQCGMGRTGRLFAHEWAGVTPDIMMVAKGIGGGFPLGAVLASEKAAAGMVAGTHGSTYGGNPLACAVGAKVMEIIATPAFLSEVNRKAALFRQKLEALVAAHPAIFETVRGQGLILGLKCKVAPADFVKAGYGEHVLTVPAADNVVRLLPPLTLTDDDIAEAATRLDRAASALERTL